MPSELWASKTLDHDTPCQFVNKKECNEKRCHKVSIEHFDQISKSEAMAGPASLWVTIVLVFWGCPSHREKVESKVDILLYCQETENSCRYAVDEVCKFRIYHNCVTVNGENLIDFLWKCFMVSADMHSKEWFNKVFRVTKSGPYEYERFESKDKLDFCFVWHSHKATWKYSMTQICKDKH